MKRKDNEGLVVDFYGNPAEIEQDDWEQWMDYIEDLSAEREITDRESEDE